MNTRRRKRKRGRKCIQGNNRNFPNLGKETDIRSRRHRELPSKINKSRPTRRHIVIRFVKYVIMKKNRKSNRAKEVLSS